MSTDQELIQLFKQLDQENRRSLLAFARFLVQQSGEGAGESVDTAPEPAAKVPDQPVSIPRPAKETLVEAIKRLTATYPMLDKASLLNETSALVAQHVMKGRNLVEVINELEGIFRGHYDRYLDKQGRP